MKKTDGIPGSKENVEQLVLYHLGIYIRKLVFNHHAAEVMTDLPSDPPKTRGIYSDLDYS